jgi:hypothetical protein
MLRYRAQCRGVWPARLCICAAAWLLGSAFLRYDSVRAQESELRDSQDILGQPPPEPETTRLEITAPPARAPQPARAAPRPEPTKPKPAPPPTRAMAKARLPEDAPIVDTQPGPRNAPTKKAAPPETTQPGPEPTGAEPEPEVDEHAPPPPPSSDGDFAGHGGVSGTETTVTPTDNTLPQDDFAGEVQEYRRRQRREFSVRFDPLNWLLLGRLNIELEVSLFKYLSVQLTPVFVTSTSPIAVNYAGLDDPLTQHSNGLGPISGVSLGVGAWFWGQPFKGYVLRLEFTNYAYSYRTADAAGPLDRVDFTERRLILFVGSHSRFGPFTFAGGFGLGYELHQVSRCGLNLDSDSETVRGRSSDCHGKQEIALDRELRDRADLNGPLHPVYFQARFTLGVVF